MPIDGELPLSQDIRVIEAGTILSRRYLIEREIGSGGMSTVFSALDRHRMQGDAAADAKVAVKVLNRVFRNDRNRIDRLTREFRYMQRLTHRGILRVFDLDCDDDTWFITMELLQGQSLVQYMHRHDPNRLPTDEALRLLTECTEALVYAHDHGVIHGDLKPGNIFVDEMGTARLLDFGSVSERGETADAAHDRFLTPAYASPQMLEQQPADPRDDLFSLGCVAFELFTGAHPFKSLSSLDARKDGLRPMWVPSIPARHFGVLARMLSWERDTRPANGQEFLDSLTAVRTRGKVVYSREPRPPGAASETLTPPSVRKNALSGGEHVFIAATARNEPSLTATQVRRTFAQFPGKVPDNWAGLGAPAPAAAMQAAARIEQPATLASLADEPDRAESRRWPERKPGAEHGPGAARRAVPWLSQLRWNGIRGLNRVRHDPHAPSRSEVVPLAGKEPDVVQVQPAGSPRPVSGEPPVPKPAQPDWIPQLQWRNEIALHWTDVQAATAAVVVPQVQIGTLPVSALPTGSPGALAPAARAGVERIEAGVRRIDWRKTSAAISRVSMQSRAKLHALTERHRRHRRSGSRSSAQSSRQLQPWSAWLTRAAPRWPDAAPAMAIAGIAFIVWGLLQVSNASRPIATPPAEREHQAALRLQALAGSPVEITAPTMTDLPLPSIPVDARPPAPPDAPGLISFQSAHIRVSAGQQMAVVHLLRNRSTSGAAPFAWRITPGTALPDIDYEQPRMQSARFNDGQDIRSLFIPIKPSLDGGRPERSFTIKLMKTPGGPAFGAITETEVVIEGSG